MTPGDDDDEDSELYEPIELPISEQPTVDAGDPKKVKKRKLSQKLLEREETRFWQGVFRSEIGRRCMWKLLAEGHPFTQKFACGPNGFPQTEATWFHAGEQDLAERMFQTWFKNHPAEVMAMLIEHDPRFAPTKKDE